MVAMLQLPQKHTPQRRPRGFTVVELVLVIALVGAVAALAMPASRGMFTDAQLAQAKTQAAEALRLAQARAQAGTADGDWGVRFAADTVTLFQGPSFAARNASFDERMPTPGGTAFAGTTDIVFTSISGTTDSNHFTLLSEATNATYTFTVNTWGALTASP